MVSGGGVNNMEVCFGQGNGDERGSSKQNRQGVTRRIMRIYQYFFCLVSYHPRDK